MDLLITDNLGLLYEEKEHFNSQDNSEASNVKVCEIEDSLKAKLKSFRFRKANNNAAIIMKLDKDKRLIVIDEEYEDYTIEQVRDELPESQPRYVVYSYVYSHEDGRTSYPLCFIFVSPQGCNPEQQMMYTGSLKTLIGEIGLTKVFEVRSTDELTEEWLKEKLQFFR